LKKNRICKICRHELAPAILYLHLCEGYSYKRIIEAYGRFIPNLNLYNISNHLNFHISEKDIKEAEESKARWEKYKAKYLAREANA
jgi:hypothetical protein